MLSLFMPVALMFSGLAGGGLMIATLGGAPLLLILPRDRYVPIHQFLVTRFDPFMPLSMTTAMVFDLALAFTAPNLPARLFSGAACLLLLAAMIVSLTKNVPINRWIRTLDPDNLPLNFDQLDPRVRWRNWNAVRTAFAIVALLCNGGALAVTL